MVLLALALGSCFRFDIVGLSFYVRFFVLGLIALKSLALLVRSNAVDPAVKRWTACHFILLYVACYGLVGSIYSFDPSLSFQRALSFLLFFMAVGHYFWVKIATEEQVDGLLQSLWKTTAIVFVISVILLALIPGQLRYGGRWRLVFFSPNQLGHFASMMTPIAVWHCFEKPARRKWSIAILVFLGGSLLGSGSRSAIIGAFCGTMALFLACYRRQAIYLASVMAFLLAANALFKMDAPTPVGGESFMQEHLVRGHSLQTGSGRTGVWKSAWQLIRRKPAFGYGFGVTDKLFSMRMFEDLPYEFQGGHTHNSFVEELVNLGFLGGIPIFLAIALFLAAGARFASTSAGRTHARAALFMAAFGSFICGVVSGFFESWFTAVGSFFCFPFWLLGMMLLRLERIARAAPPAGEA